MHALTARFHESMRNPSNAYAQSAQLLYQRVMAGMEKHLLGRRQIFLSTDGILSFVPFAALHDGREFLLERYEFTYLTSGRDLLRSQRSGPVGAALILGAPDYENLPLDPGRVDPTQNGPIASRLAPLVQGLKALPWTEVEAKAVYRSVPGAQLKLGREATETRLLSVRAPRILHIATHGVFLNDEPPPPAAPALTSARMVTRVDLKAGATPAPLPAVAERDPLTRSALVMAGARRLAAKPVTVGGEPRDGLVTALEVGSMDLEGTELVVLSACETGLGQGTARQGVYGLRRAFFSAGAQTLVTSLWAVSDQGTQALMTGYYERLSKGEGRVTAMHKAMKELRKSKEHPYYWAPFIVLGSGASLSPINR